MQSNERKIRRCQPDATAISYTLLRHLGLMLDELSVQGLEVWCDAGHVWHWHWAGTALQSERGLWALGETIVDAVAARYPDVFDGRSLMGEEE
jgi:hypothetical protein